jgi:hypothetical protein
MVLQIEDCIDCLQFLHSDEDYVFELDHSSGHACEWPDRLTTTTQQLNWNWGGKQRLMQESMLTTNCIGEVRHARAAEVGKPYSHVFCENNLPQILDLSAPKHDGDIIKFKENQVINVPELESNWKSMG